MSSESPTLTKTERNLWNAIVAEALAHLKYNAFAHKALEEGLPEVAQIFQEVAGAETIHGINHLRVSGDIGTTAENLRAVAIGESKEASTLYPRMIQDALAEGRTDAADSFGMALERERHHLEMFTQALEQLQARRRGPAAPGPVAKEVSATPEAESGPAIGAAPSPPAAEAMATMPWW